MEQLEKGTIVDVPSDDVANKLLREYGAFFERDGQEIVVSSDNAIKMNDDGTLYFKKPNGEWEEILVTGEQEQEEEVVEEEYEEEEVSETADAEDEAEDELEYQPREYTGGYEEKIRQRMEKVWQHRYERRYGKVNENTEPKKKSDKILTGSDLNDFISHVCDYKSGIKISNEHNISGLQEFRKKYVNNINGCTLELYWNEDGKNPIEKFQLGTTMGINKLLNYQYDYSKIPENERVDGGKIDLPSACHNGSLREPYLCKATKYISEHSPGHKKPEQILKYVAYVEIANNLKKILNFTKRDCHTSKGAEFVDKIKNVWIPFLQADQNVSKEARKDNFIEGLNLFVNKAEAEMAKQYEEDIGNDDYYYDKEQKNMHNKYANLGVLDPQNIFNFK